MNWDSFNTYNAGYRPAFESLNNQLFERYLFRNYSSSVKKFRVVNGSGGDGGVESFAEVANGTVIAVQLKWFRHVLASTEITQIRNSILAAKKARPRISEYIILYPA